MHQTKSQKELQTIEDKYYHRLKSPQGQYELLSDFEMFLQKKLVYDSSSDRLNTQSSKLTKEQENALKQNYRAYAQKHKTKKLSTKKTTLSTQQQQQQQSSQEQEQYIQQQQQQQYDSIQDFSQYDPQLQSIENRQIQHSNIDQNSPYFQSPTTIQHQQQSSQQQFYPIQQNSSQQNYFAINFMDNEFQEKEEKELQKYRKKYKTQKFIQTWKKDKNNRIQEMLQGQQILQNNFYQAKRRHVQQQQNQFSKVYSLSNLQSNQSLQQQQDIENNHNQYGKAEYKPSETELKYPLNHSQKQHVQRIKSASHSKARSRPTMVLRSNDTYQQDLKERQKHELENFDKQKLKLVEEQYSSQIDRMNYAISSHITRIKSAKTQPKVPNFFNNNSNLNNQNTLNSSSQNSHLDSSHDHNNNINHTMESDSVQQQNQELKRHSKLSAPFLINSRMYQSQQHNLNNSKKKQQQQNNNMEFSSSIINKHKKFMSQIHPNTSSTPSSSSKQQYRSKLNTYSHQQFPQFQSQQQLQQFQYKQKKGKNSHQVSIKHQSEQKLKHLRELSKQNQNSDLKPKEFTIQKPDGTLEFPQWLQIHPQFQQLTTTKQFNMDKKILAVCELEAFRRSTNEKQVICLFLQQLSLFRIMPESLLMELSGQLSTKSFEDGEMICKKGDRADSMYIIYNGGIQVLDSHNSDTVNKVYKEGEIVGKEVIETCEQRLNNLRSHGQTNLLLLSRINYQQCLSVSVDKMKPKIKEFLNKIPFLYQHFKKEIIDNIFEHVKGRYYHPKETVYFSGQKTDNFYIVMQGKLQQKIIVPVQAENRWPVSINGQPKWEKRICSKQVEYTNYYEAQDVLGYYDLIHTNEDFVRTETVEASTDSFVLYINKIDFLTVFTREDYDMFEEYHKRRYTVTLEQREQKIRQAETQNKNTILTYENAIRQNLQSYNCDELDKKAQKLLPLMQRGKLKRKQSFKKNMPYSLSKPEYAIVNTMYD